MRFFCFILLGIITLNCSDTKTNRSKLIHFIPKNTLTLVKTSNFESLKSSIKNSDFLQRLSITATYKQLENKLDYLSYLNTTEDLLICFSQDERDSLHYTTITKYHPDIFKSDSLTDYTEETFKHKSKSITRSKLNGNTFYSTIVDSIFFTSSSKKITETVYNNSPQNIELQKLYNTIDITKTASIISESNTFFIKPFFLEDSINTNSFTNYTALDVDINQDETILNGITKAIDSSKSLINIFKNTIPQENLCQNVVPANSDGFMSFTFNNFKDFETNLSKFKGTSGNITTTLFDNVNEIGIIYEGSEQAIVLNSIDVIATEDALASEQSKVSTYREIPIFNFSSPDLFSKTFSPLVTFKKASKYCLLDNFFVFANDIELLQNIISNYQNKTTFSERSYFKTIKEQLSDAASLLVVNSASSLENTLSKNFDNNSVLKLDNYKASAIQFIYDTNFAHVNGIIKKSKTKAKLNSISEELTVKLNKALLNSPQFVTNHITNQKEIVVQDINNNLYLISNKGKVLWKKQLHGPVLGTIKQIDIYKNGRLQLAFATPHRVYVIDRNGNDVAPFPGKFNDEITQPLSVFDYDKNKNYRLLVTQGKHVLMYNVKAQIVKGFIFKSANNQIISQPKHFRIGSKDYIIIKTQSKLYILDRTGRKRITPKTTNTTFSTEAIYLFRNKFTTTTADGSLISIDTKGNTATQNLELSKNHSIVASSKTLVAHSENKLSIKNNTIEIDYGSYSMPKLFYINDKIYVAITDLQSHKVYLYDSLANLLPNFPVYGNSAIDLDQIDKDRNLEFVIKGEDNTVIVYKIN
ncbi:ribonuclease HII [Snuella sedimenti]|uniref:Ribonuclease HII n=1 Tax=Snuella sedimenti TaxID=2798802 RepID=A0A8J7JDT2_9FLAO|nr:ribonuclease HII [Snuella sedimenti]MBJ6369319.1 ribonuclease HII [Snuella sedimenti]